MTNEQEFTYPEFVVIVKNTEVFKKGGVFERDGSYYYQRQSGFVVEPYSTNLTKPQVQLLIQKNVAVEAVKFNPEFVTLEQNEILTKALTASTKKAVKKAPAKTANKPKVSYAKRIQDGKKTTKKA